MKHTSTEICNSTIIHLLKYGKIELQLSANMHSRNSIFIGLTNYIIIQSHNYINRDLFKYCVTELYNYSNNE